MHNRRVREIFHEVSQLLEDGRPFLTGNTMTAADITFASMAAILMMPPEYPVQLPTLDELPADFPGAELRATPAGQHVLKMYRLYRKCGQTSQVTMHRTSAAKL